MESRYKSRCSITRCVLSIRIIICAGQRYRSSSVQLSKNWKIEYKREGEENKATRDLGLYVFISAVNERWQPLSLCPAYVGAHRFHRPSDRHQRAALAHSGGRWISSFYELWIFTIFFIDDAWSVIGVDTILIFNSNLSSSSFVSPVAISKLPLPRQKRASTHIHQPIYASAWLWCYWKMENNKTHTDISPSPMHAHCTWGCNSICRTMKNKIRTL